MCGIFAVINQVEEPFDYQTFCTLGCANDRRGKDSCGVFIDGKVEYGIDKTALFESFFWSSNLLNNTATAKIALGHDRKASPGMAVNLQNAHPIIIEEEIPITDEDDLPADGEKTRKEIKFVMVHNGTIYNYKKLAEKYIPDIDIKDMTDSQVLARIIYYAGFDCLAEYNGGTAFIAVDYRTPEPTVLLWRGESKKSIYYKSEPEEERPLFCNTENQRLVVSSIPSSVAITDGNCYNVIPNTVLTYKNGKLYKIKEIDRSNAQQNEKYETSTFHTNNYNTNNINTVSYIKYLRPLAYDNTYKIGANCADGEIRMTCFGKVLAKYEGYSATEKPQVVFFFNGIPIYNKPSYTFLMKAWRLSKLSLEEFTKVYQNFIRYFSVDRCYYDDNNILWEANEPFARKVYTGYIQMLTNAAATYFINGKETSSTKINSIYDSFDWLKENRKYDYKIIWKQFIQSMA